MISLLKEDRLSNYRKGAPTEMHKELGGGIALVCPPIPIQISMQRWDSVACVKQAKNPNSNPKSLSMKVLTIIEA